MRKLISTALLSVLTACTAATDPTAPPTTPSGPPVSTPSVPTPTPSTPVAVATTGTRTVTVYTLVTFRGSTMLAPERRSVPRTPAIARAALESMVRGRILDPDHRSPWPRDARILGITIRSGTAIVDWSAEVLEASVGSTEETLGIQQALYTLLRLNAGVRRLELRVEGKTRGTASNGRRIEDWWGHVGLQDQPFSPMDHVEASIAVWAPIDGTRVGRRLIAEGEASTFEANVGIRLRNAAGRVVRSTSTTATAGPPERGSWRIVLSLTGLAPGRYTFEAYEASAKDGSVTFAETRVVTITS